MFLTLKVVAVDVVVLTLLLNDLLLRVVNRLTESHRRLLVLLVRHFDVIYLILYMIILNVM